MTKSFCHHITIPSELMDIIEEDLTNNFDNQMQISKLWVIEHKWIKETLKMHGFLPPLGWVV